MSDEFKPNILLLAPYSFPPICAESLATCKFIKACLDKGWDVSVIAQNRHAKLEPKKINTHWDCVEKVTYKIDINSHSSSKWFVNKLRLLIWVYQSTILGIKLINSGKYDVIFSRATPLYGHLLGFLVRTVSKKKVVWVANWSDPMPLSKAPPPYGQGIKAKISFIEKKLLSLIGNGASYHTFPTERLKDYYASFLPEISNKSGVIHHVALDAFNISPQENDVFTLCCSGSFTLRPVKLIFIALSRLQKRYGNQIHLRLLTSEMSRLKEEALECEVESIVKIEPLREYHENQEYLATSSALMIIEAQCNEGIFLPSKLTDYIQIGLPILAISPPIGALNDLFTNYGGGIAADNTSVESIEKAIELLYQEWLNGSLHKNFGSCHLRQYFGNTAVLEQLKDAIQVAKINHSTK